MGLRINTNLASINSQRHLRNVRGQLEGSFEKLSSGLRINKAADDAAGLSISENFRAQIRGLGQANRNANDGISLIQTAEGGLNEVSNILIRLRELSVQAASDTIGDAERGFLDQEFSNLTDEIQRIAESTRFGQYQLLNGQGESLDFQVGIRNNPSEDRITYDLQKVNASIDALGLGGLNTLSKDSARDSLEVLDAALQKVSGNRAYIGAQQNRLSSTIRNLEGYSENLSAAYSRIRDTDFANETAELTKNSIMTQSAISILSQANQVTSLATKLL